QWPAPAPREAARAVGPVAAPLEHRLGGEEVTQVVRQRRHGRITLGGFAPQCLEDDRIDVGWYAPLRVRAQWSRRRTRGTGRFGDVLIGGYRRNATGDPARRRDFARDDRVGDHVRRLQVV